MPRFDAARFFADNRTPRAQTPLKAHGAKLKLKGYAPPDADSIRELVRSQPVDKDGVRLITVTSSFVPVPIFPDCKSGKRDQWAPEVVIAFLEGVQLNAPPDDVPTSAAEQRAQRASAANQRAYDAMSPEAQAVLNGNGN